MIDKKKRKEMEKDGSTSHPSPIDKYPPGNKFADPSCKTCKGHGVVDEGLEWGATYILCPDCWKNNKLNDKRKAKARFVNGGNSVKGK